MSEENRERIQKSCDAINQGLAADGITDIVAVPTSFLINAANNAELVEKLGNQCSTCPYAPKDNTEPVIVQGFNDRVQVISDFESAPRPEDAHLARDTAQDIINAKERKRKALRR